MSALAVFIAAGYTAVAVWAAATVPPTPKMAWCQVAEISPDVPPADKAACRRSRKLSLAANGR